MKDVDFWNEVKANLREAYASALYWQERARVAREQGDSDRERAYLLLMALTFQITEKREQWRVRHAYIYKLATYRRRTHKPAGLCFLYREH